ncbi:hypothetical protein LOAG_10398 [Loa loa]|uniref:Uncharacterized protein n=1 Tax=Loa loa TaxID=7209 RepID=A0A1I7W1X9_LOALO|nr:hypothetical protein LOAG_10398 [Loa loa]EFO18100.2 hypothetical protein LOAG_10398 [Loa loa]
MLFLICIKQGDEVSLSSYALNGVYPDGENFIGTNNQTTKTTEDRRMPAYRAAMLEVCQLQLKICSKLIELASPSCPTLFGLKTFKPSTLKRLAGRSILLHPYGLIGIFCRKSGTDGDIGIADNDNGGSCYHQMLPNELIKFLQNGAMDYD